MRAAAAAAALLASLAAPSRADAPEVRRIPAAAVERAFARGTPLFETGDYKLHASRRDAPGEAEVHVRDTDIFYLLEGSARLVTGGAIRSPTEVGPGELRGPAIDGGIGQEIAAGDVLVIPRGVPHWFESVHAPVVYYVVKVTR